MLLSYSQVRQGVRLLFIGKSRHVSLSSKMKNLSTEVEIIGTSYECVGKSAIVRVRGAENKKIYLINCSEVIPRIINHRRYKMGSLNNIFVTHCCWRNIGGIPLFLHRKRSAEMASGNFRSLIIHGTGETVDYLKHNERVVQESSILLRPLWDDNFEVTAMVFTPSFEDLQDIELLGSRSSSVGYHFRELHSMGQNSSILFIENPSIGHIKAMLNHEAFKQCLTVNPPKLVVHFTEGDLLGIVEHCQLMELFPAECKHIFVDGKNDAEAMYEVNKRQAVLHYFGSRRIYPLLAHQPNHEFPVDPSKPYQVLSGQEWMKLTRSLINLIKLDLRPFGIQNQFQILNRPSVVEKVMDYLKLEGMNNSWSAVPMFEQGIGDNGSLREPTLRSTVPTSMCTMLALDLVRQDLSSIDRLCSLQRSILDTVEELQRDGKLASEMSEYPRMVFLGTGATSGSLFRSCSGLLLRLSDDESILLDCGDGIMNRLFTMYGKAVGKVLLSIRYVFITHLHRDHFHGLAQVLQYRRYHAQKTGQRVPNVCVVASRKLTSYLNDIDMSLGSGCIPEYRFRPLHDDEGREDRPLSFDLPELEIEVLAVPVIHSLTAFGFVVKHRSGWTMVYSGDTMPCQELVEAGKGCDLLIHEATLDNCYVDRALSTMHSTTQDAVKISLDMAAKFVILTHFTQGYRLLEHLDQVPDNVSFASDFMQVTLDDLPYLQHLRKIMPLLLVNQTMPPDQK